MGRDKALVEFEGRPLVERALGILKEAGLAVSIAGAREGARLESYAPVISDPSPGLGPLAGICSGLRSSPAARGVFLPVDVPLLPSSLIEYMLRHARVTGSAVTLVSVNGFVQTFPAVLGQEILPVLERRLGNGEGGCLVAFRAGAAESGRGVDIIAVEILVQSGQVGHPQALPPVRWWQNVNSGRDLEQLRRWARVA
jgi:molybdopterin-guanine dinucleotide biosynthesis protein A